MKKQLLKIFLTMLILVIVMITCAFIGFYLLIGQYNIECPKFNNTAYFEWFPYNEGDTLIFQHKLRSKKYIVNTYEINHTEEYFALAKCGCCEESLQTLLVSEKDSIEIFCENINNTKSCLGQRVNINHFEVYGTKLFKDSLIAGEKKQYIILKDSIFVIKNKGITTIKDKKRTWQLKEIIKKNTKRKIIETGC